MAHKDPSRKAPLALVENHLGAQRVVVGAAHFVPRSENALPKPTFEEFFNTSAAAATSSNVPVPIAAAPKPVQKAASPKKPSRAASPRRTNPISKACDGNTVLDVAAKEQQVVGQAVVPVVPKPVATAVKTPRASPWKIEITQDGKLSEDGLSITKHSAAHCYARGSDGWSNGVHEWKVKIESGNVDLGVVMGSASQTTEKYALDCSNGKAFDPSRKRHACLDVPVDGLAVGSCITLRLDLERHTLAFALDDQAFVEPFTHLPAGTYYPHFAVYSKNRPVSVVSQK